jgi:hypothetical protein
MPLLHKPALTGMHLVQQAWMPSGQMALVHFFGKKKGLSVKSDNPVLLLILSDAP